MTKATQPGKARRARVWGRAGVGGFGAMLALAGCAQIDMVRFHPEEAAVVVGPPVRDSMTPLDGALACLGDLLAGANGAPFGIAVGDIKDYTGKYNQNEGTAITQGGALMAYSALGKIGDAVRIHERFDTRIAEAELAYINQRQLGDGESHTVPGANGGGPKEVPWMPYFGGTILASEYYIVGGITELNYNIQSGGAEFAVGSVGPKARVFTMNIAADLRIVDSRSLVVRETVSLEKQITGYEVGFNIFRFFGDDLFDVNIGAKNQEPLQLGVRTTIEAGVFELIAAVAGVDAVSCLPDHLRAGVTLSGGRPVTAEPATGAQPEPMDAGSATPTDPATAPTPSQPSLGAMTDYQVAFEPGEVSVSGRGIGAITSVASAVEAGQTVTVVLVARETETFGPGVRDALTSRRIEAVVEALARHGVSNDRVLITWTPAPSSTEMRRDGPGFQELARLQVAGR